MNCGPNRIIKSFFLENDAKLFHEQELQEEEINLARTLIIVVLVFIFCQSVKLIPDLYEVFYCSIEPKCDSLLWIEAIIDVSHLLLAINSSCNVVIYTFSRKQFQENISDLIQRRKSKSLKKPMYFYICIMITFMFTAKKSMYMMLSRILCSITFVLTISLKGFAKSFHIDFKILSKI